MGQIPPRRNGGLGRRSVVKVKLSGLKIAHARGKYYVYLRATGETLLRGFDGDKEALLRRLSMPDMLAAYNRPRDRARRAETFSVETLGGFINWFTNGDIDRTAEERKAEDRFGDKPEGYPKWRTKLAAATRKDYLEAFEWLRDEFDILLTDITQPDLYDLRDKCANQKWPRFADQMISALSSMFGQAVKRGRSTGMKINPCLGACLNSRCSILGESDSTLGYEQVFSPLEYRSDAASAAECAGLCAERPCLAVYRRAGAGEPRSQGDHGQLCEWSRAAAV